MDGVIQARAAIAICLFTCALVLGCGQQASDAYRVIESQVKDPQNVQYREVRTYNGGVVCGQFNAKNSFGAYVGFMQFVYNAPQAGAIDLEASLVKVAAWCNSSPVRAEAIQHMCDQSWSHPRILTDLGCKAQSPAPATTQTDRPNAGR